MDCQCVPGAATLGPTAAQGERLRHRRAPSRAKPHGGARRVRRRWVLPVAGILGHAVHARSPRGRAPGGQPPPRHPSRSGSKADTCRTAKPPSLSRPRVVCPMIALSIALVLLFVVLALPTVSDLVSLVRISIRRGRRTGTTTPGSPQFLFLVPAHDEELLLPSCLQSLRRLRYPRERIEIVVIADNCRDRTADIAGAAGVRCLVRTAPNEAGKPRAIAWALSQLRVTDYDAVVIVDADTEVDRKFAAQLAVAAPLARKALQPYNGVSNRSENALTRMAAVLSGANHGLAYVLKTRAGVNVPLSAGMCVGSGVLAAHGWTAYSLSEDWELYALLTERGVSIEAVPGAQIYAQEAATLKAGASQRRGWKAGGSRHPRVAIDSLPSNTSGAEARRPSRVECPGAHRAPLSRECRRDCRPAAPPSGGQLACGRAPRYAAAPGGLHACRPRTRPRAHPRDRGFRVPAVLRRMAVLHCRHDDSHTQQQSLDSYRSIEHATHAAVHPRSLPYYCAFINHATD